MDSKPVRSFINGVKTASNILAYISAGMLLLMMFLGTADVTGRYLFNKPIWGTVEIFEIMLLGLVLFSLAHTQDTGSHIKVELFYSRLSGRLKPWIGLGTTLIAFFLFVLIVWQGIVTAMGYRKLDREIMNIGLPLYPFQFFVPLGAFCMCLVLIVDIINYATEIRRAG